MLTARGDRIDYDALVLATGSYPFVPPVPGHDLPACHVYRTLDDLDALRAVDGGRAPVGVVIGGGLPDGPAPRRGGRRPARQDDDPAVKFRSPRHRGPCEI